MRHYIHKVTMHFDHRSSVSCTPNIIAHSDKELEDLREQYKQKYSANSVTFIESRFDGELDDEQLAEIQRLMAYE